MRHCLLTLLLATGTALADPVAGSVIENSLGMKFVLVPAGSFLMGDQDSLAAWQADYPQYDTQRFLDLDDEAPVHRVNISKPFYLGQHEVTVGQFRRFVEASGHVPESEADQTGGYGYNPAYNPETSASGDAFEGRNRRYSWKNPGFPQADTHPVLNVTLGDAKAMAAWLSQQEGVRYRLPTEAEWEYACKAGSTTRYYNGNDPQQLPQIANTFDADAATYWPKWKNYAIQGSDGHAFTAPVGSFTPNAFGVYDMIGNAWEWVSDKYDETYYAHTPGTDPTGGSTGGNYVRRGGSWHTWALYARCAFRNINTPQTRYTLLGMRLLREVPMP